MNLAQEKIEIKFKNLLDEGKWILNQCGWNGQEYNIFPSDIDYQRWRMEAINLIERLCGRKSVHYEALSQIIENKLSKFNSFYFKECYGILEAAFNDYKDGLLVEIRNLIRADLLDDLISQSEALNENGYYVAAASIAGAVLEDTLRKLCDKNSITYPDKTNINTLNAELARAEVYDKLIQKEITAKADLRNNADHGQFDKVRKADVEDMVRWIRRFVSEWIN